MNATFAVCAIQEVPALLSTLRNNIRFAGLLDTNDSGIKYVHYNIYGNYILLYYHSLTQMKK